MSRLAGAILLLSLASVMGAAQARAATIVVLPIGDDAALTDDLRAALARYGTVQAAANTAESLAAAKSVGIACDQAATPCLAELGGLAGGDLVIGGVAEPESNAAGEGSSLTLRLVEVSTAKLVRRVALFIPQARGVERARALRLLSVRLVAPDAESGTITVLAPPGAAIQLDGDAVGTAPLREPFRVAPGKHEVYAALTGYVSKSEIVDVDVGQDATVSLELTRDADGDGEADAQGRPARHTTPIVPRDGRVGITAVEGIGVDARIRHAVAEAIASELEKLEGVTVVPLADVEGELDPNKAVMLACHEPGCHSLIAGELALQDILVVELELRPEESGISVKRYDGTTGVLLIESVHDGLKPDGGHELAPVIHHAVARVFPRIHVRPGAVSGIERLDFGAGKRRPPLPSWLFWSSLAATGVAAGAAGGFAAWTAADKDAPGTVDLAMWVAVGATAALIAADVAVALSTDWDR